MFDRNIFQNILTEYKKDFAGQWWEDEKYKWEMVRWFQDHWDIEAGDFPAMLSEAMKKTDNLLASKNRYPLQILQEICQAEPEKVRSLFRGLYDESEDYVERIGIFKKEIAGLFNRCNESRKLSKIYNEGYFCYQDENPISIYLWLRYPNTHYIYKFSEAQYLANVLKSSYKIKRGAFAENLRQNVALFDEISETLRGDAELCQLLRERLTENCWPDEALHIMTGDLSYYVYDKNVKAKKGAAEKAAAWIPEGYDPQISRDDWAALLKDPSIFTLDSLAVMARMQAAGGEASCTQLAEKYGETKNFYNVQSSALGRRVAEKTGCSLYTAEDGSAQYWPVLYLSRDAGKEEPGAYVWKLRPELAEALTDADLSGVPLHAEEHVLKEDTVVSAEPAVPAYTRDDFLSEVYMDGAAFDRLAALVRRKKNVILEGAPGVGKTFAARRLAWALMGARDDSRIEMVQFHQSYSYEDFILGYKPDGEGFRLQEGVFYRFCEKAAERPGEDFFFLIDEINRGNLSKIFGELLMAIEKEYRGQAVRLPEGDRTFSVPENVYLIGMMNTADRSLALIDYALRRRFGFFEMEPGFSSEGFRAYQARLGDPHFDALVRTVEALNRDIAQDPSLGKGFCIGHSYFCGAETDTEAWMESVVEYDLLPTLREYWYDEEETYRRWEARLREAVHGEE